MWVRSEYAGELAVLSVWLCALLPWSVSWGNRGVSNEYRFHFVYLFFRFLPGFEFGQGAFPRVYVSEAAARAPNESVTLGYRLWLLGAAVFTLVLFLSVVYYRYDEALEERAPVDPARLVGGLLVASATFLTGTVYFLMMGFPGRTLPVGVVFMYVLGGVLLGIERT
jgi:hypothetical protein